MAPVNLHDGETFVRIRIAKWAGDFEVFEYLNCYAFYAGDRLFVRSYDDSPDMLPRANFRNQDALVVEHYGEHKPTKKAARRPAEAPAAPSADLPTDEESEAAMERFLAAAPKAESHLPERKFLESTESDVAPKEEWSIAGTSLSDQKTVVTPSAELTKTESTVLNELRRRNTRQAVHPLPENIPGTPLPPTEYLPLETQPEEIERRASVLRPKVELAKEIFYGVAIASTAGPEMNFSGSVENRATRRAQSKGSHKRPKPSTGQALSALVFPLLTFFLAGFRHRMG